MNRPSLSYRHPALTLVMLVATAGFVGDARHCRGDDTNRKALRERCTTILKKHVEAPLPKDDDSRAVRVSRLDDYPLAWVEDTLVRALSDQALGVKLASADVLSAKAPDKHKQRILVALSDVQCKKEDDLARVAVIRLRLNQPRALEDVRRWAALQIKLADIAPGWTCAMHPQVRTAKKGRCPICAMDLLSVRGRPTYAQRRAQHIALAALAEQKDQELPHLAARLLASDAEAYWRLQAAHAWARVSPRDAVPHVDVFLNSPDNHVAHTAFTIVAKECPKKYVTVFQAVLRDKRSPSYERLVALEGLLNAGHGEYIKEIREIAVTEDKKVRESLAHYGALKLLAKFGTAEDLPRLVRYPDGLNDAPSAAELVLQLLDRLDGN